MFFCCCFFYHLLKCRFWFGKMVFFLIKGTFLLLWCISHTLSIELSSHGKFTVTKKKDPNNHPKIWNASSPKWKTLVNMNTPPSVWCSLLCDGFLWVHLQVTGNTDGDMRSTLEHFYKHARTLNTRTQSLSRAYALVNNSAWRRVFIRLISPYIRYTQTVRGSTRQKALRVSGSVLCYGVETDKDNLFKFHASIE